MAGVSATGRSRRGRRGSRAVPPAVTPVGTGPGRCMKAWLVRRAGPSSGNRDATVARGMASQERDHIDRGLRQRGPGQGGVRVRAIPSRADPSLPVRRAALPKPSKLVSPSRAAVCRATSPASSRTFSPADGTSEGFLRVACAPTPSAPSPPSAAPARSPCTRRGAEPERALPHAPARRRLRRARGRLASLSPRRRPDYRRA